MLRLLTILFLLVFAFPVAAQRLQAEGEYAAHQPGNISPRELSEQLTSGKTSEYDKVKSIFDWITENIAYRSQHISKRNSSPQITEEDTSAVLKPLNERVSQIVLKNRLAVCDGYARLFKTLCDHAGLRSEIIIGFVRNSSRKAAFQTNHSWNAVMIEGEWHLVDATWATGYVNYSGQFVRQYDRHFFLADPDDMLQTHYPENPFWTLKKKHTTPHEFRSQPLKYFAWHRTYIDKYSPRTGIIEVNKDVPVQIVLETKEAKRDLILTTDPFAFLSPVTDAGWKRNYVVEGNKITGTWMPGNDKPEWLFVVLNGEVIMRYFLRYN